MKSKSLFFCAVFALLSACSKGNNSNKNVNPADKVNQANNKNEIKVEDLKYAGAVVFEVGTTKNAFDLKNLKPASRIYVCIDRSGTTKVGKFDVNFASLGVAPYRSISKESRTNEITDSWDLPSLTINYEFSGMIELQEPYAWGEVTFKSTTSNRKWKHVLPDDGASNNNADFFDLPGVPSPFKLKTGKGSFGAESEAYYEVDGVTYYINSTLWRFVKNPDDGAHPIADCESQNETVFVKMGDDLKPTKK